MTKDQAKRFCENHGYKVTYVMGSYPTPGYYMAKPNGCWGQIKRANSLNGLAKIISPA